MKILYLKWLVKFEKKVLLYISSKLLIHWISITYKFYIEVILGIVYPTEIKPRLNSLTNKASDLRKKPLTASSKDNWSTIWKNDSSGFSLWLSVVQYCRKSCNSYNMYLSLVDRPLILNILILLAFKYCFSSWINKNNLQW